MLSYVKRCDADAVRARRFRGPPARGVDAGASAD